MSDAGRRLGRIATFNIHHGAPPKQQLARRGFERVLVGAELDVLAVQEVDRFVVRSGFVDQVHLIAKATGLHPTWVPTRRMLGTGQYGHALFTRERPEAVEVVSLPTFGVEARRAVIVSTVLGGERVTIAAAHLHNATEIAARQLDVVLGRLMVRPGPHLLLGDLNAQPKAIGDQLLAAGFGPHGGPPTFPSDAPKRRLDWIVGAGIGVVDVESMDTQVSDHRPLLATMVTS